MAQRATPAQSLYGMWYSYPVGNPDTDPIRHEFRHNSATGSDEIIVTRLCPGDYRAVIARAVASIEVSGNSIRVLKTVSDSEKGENNTVCKASVEAGVLNFTISEDGNRITLTKPGGNSDILDLARQDAASEAVLSPNFNGIWLLPVRFDEGARIQIQLVFYNSADSTRGTIRQIATCSKGNDSLTSQVDSTISFTEDEFTILESATHDERNGRFFCRATITPGTFHYVVSSNGATMTLLKADTPPVTLTRDHSGLNW